ncbi:hypothetical protein [Streptomyces sp. NPDC092370]|uniref:hypothetical protein n=1 Tax=Streptomyces sp. NPDC092370 TaxID=3366016 RepID=UPI0037F2F27C
MNVPRPATHMDTAVVVEVAAHTQVGREAARADEAAYDLGARGRLTTVTGQLPRA